MLLHGVVTWDFLGGQWVVAPLVWEETLCQLRSLFWYGFGSTGGIPCLCHPCPAICKLKRWVGLGARPQRKDILPCSLGVPSAAAQPLNAVAHCRLRAFHLSIQLGSGWVLQ